MIVLVCCVIVLLGLAWTNIIGPLYYKHCDRKYIKRQIQLEKESQ
jgi:hypothetical protein